MSSLHNDLATWAGKARARGQDRIEITTETADEVSEVLMQRAELFSALKELLAEYREWNAPRGGYAETHPAYKATAVLAKVNA